MARRDYDQASNDPISKGEDARATEERKNEKNLRWDLAGGKKTCQENSDVEPEEHRSGSRKWEGAYVITLKITKASGTN